MTQKILFTMIAAYMSFSSYASAGGTLVWSDLAGLLSDSPVYAEFLGQSLQIEDVGDATRIGYGPLAGTRIGPYNFQARSIHTSTPQGSFPLKLIINTIATFTDANGEQTSDLQKAVAVKETITGIDLRLVKHRLD